jgi:phosphoserine aminotransferase
MDDSLSTRDLNKFSAVVYNLISDLKRPVDYILSGAWSEKAYEEAVRLGANAQTVISSKDSNHNGTFDAGWR